MDNKENPVTVNITNHNKFEKGVGAFITNLNHLTIVMDADGNMKMDMAMPPILPHTEVEIQDKLKDDIEKRERLIATNAVIRTETQSGKQAIDLLRLYKFIDRYFASEIEHKYEWYALRRFLEKYTLLRECDNEQFAKQMNNKEWFGSLEKQCEANEMNYYNYLNDLSPDQWNDAEKPLGSRATPRSVAKIYNTFSKLELYKDQIIGL